MISQYVENMLQALSRGRIRYIGPARRQPAAPTYDVFRRNKKDKHYYEPQYHAHPELILGLRGGAEVYVNGRWERFNPGTVWAFLPGAIHSERYILRDRDYRMLWMVVSPQIVGFHITAYDPNRGYHLVGKRLAWKVPSRSELSDLAGRPELCSPHRIRFHFQSLLMDTLYRIIPHMDKNSTRDARVPYHQQAIEQVRVYLDSHFQYDVSLAELGRMVHYSPCHLNLLFRQEVGMPIRQYVLKKRVEEAEKMLRETDQGIKQIAYNVGFQDPLYFSRVFRQFHGMPPSRVPRSGFNNAERA